jgi:hypothetical protein
MLLLLLPLAAAPTIVNAYKGLIPASLWLNVTKVYVADAVVGQAPVMDVVRSINHPFKGSWVAEVQKKQPSGDFSAFCTGTGINVYTPQDNLPDAIDLDWWTYPTRCELTPGKYRVETFWIINPANYPTKETSRRSNVFEIAPG